MFKKVLFLFVVGFIGFVAFDVIAQVTSNLSVGPVTASSVSVPLPPFDWKVFVQQLYTNGGGVLLGFLLSKLPVVGPWFKKVIDVLLANPAHK